jgi:hypothetical protein
LKGVKKGEVFMFRYNTDMISRRDRIFFITISFVFFVAIFAPFIIAELKCGENTIFGGFLFNPIDGNSYLAKMYQGWVGEWRFKLPFTSEPGDGAYLFLLYLALGHLARLFHLPLLFVFHLSRVTGSIFLLWSLWSFLGEFYENPRVRKFAFALASFGSGMGWLLLPFGAFTSDFWVAETFSFLSSYANPHFPIGLALVLWLLKPRILTKIKEGRWIFVAFGVAVLSVISPFGVVIIILILGGQILWQVISRETPKELVVYSLIILVFGLPMLFYYLWVTNTDPFLRQWNSQNLTPSPPVWDLLLSLAPPIVFGIWGIFRYQKCERQQRNTKIRSLITWAVLSFLLVYFPFGLQRRFMMGLYVPISGLAALGIESMVDKPGRYRLLTMGIMVFALPTNLIILATSFLGISTHDQSIYLNSSEYKTLTWIEENTDSDALILAGPEMGLFIPAHTGRRVLYGHPFETVNAEEEELLVQSFFGGSLSETQMKDTIRNRNVNYIFFGPREKQWGDIHRFLNWEPVFSSGNVHLYELDQELYP